jgi:hypothetical protein
MLKLLELFLIFLLFKLTCSSNSDDIEFKLPDLTVDYLTKNGHVHLEAFKTQVNNEILTNRKESDYFKLTWVSNGYPVIVIKDLEPSLTSSFIQVSHKDNSVGYQFFTGDGPLPSNLSKMFHFTREGFHFYVDMLTSEQQDLFAYKVKQKYNITINPEQIVRLIPEKFTCHLNLLDSSNINTFTLKGYVRNLREYPLTVDFFYSKLRKERIMFEERLKMVHVDGHGQFSFECSLETNGRKSRRNTFKITLDQINNLNLIDDIFGPTSDKVYLTRNQIVSLSNYIFNSLKVEEIYEIPEHQFNQKFLSNLIELVADSSFKNVDFESSLVLLSKYSLDLKHDFKPDVIKNEMSKIFKLDKSSSKTHIIVDNDYYEKLMKKSQDQSSGSASGSAFFGLFEGDASVNFVNQRESDWAKQTSSLDDQLKELNSYSENNIEWQFDGEKIVPKTINAVLAKKANFRKTLNFDRIYEVYNDAEFKREFTLNVNAAKVAHYLTDESYSSKRIASLEKLSDQLNTELENLKQTQNISSTNLESAIKNESSLVGTSITLIHQKIQDVKNSFHSVNSLIGNLDSKISAKLTACRVCFLETEGSSQCQGNRNSCSAYTSVTVRSPEWTSGFRDDTDKRGGGCMYHWKVECF